MNRSLLANLQGHEAYPSVSLLLATTPGPSLAADDLVAVIGLVAIADQRLRGDVTDDVRHVVLEKIRHLVQAAAPGRATDGLAVFVSPEYSAVVRLATGTRSRVVIDNTFATRDLVADAHQTASYRVVTLSEHTCRVFTGDRARLVEEHGGRWPLQRSDEQNQGVWHRAMTAALDDEDARRPLPTIVAGVNRTTREVSAATSANVIGSISGNHDRTSWVDLHNQAWPLVCDWLRANEQRALDQLDTARGANRYAGGIDEVWELARDARVELLVVEESYVYPARLCDGQLEPAVDVESPDVIDDAVDELIEIVMQSRGRVAILTDGELTDHHRLAATLRY